ncbi:MAG: DnaB-like helicase C-terminal domain-containing protein [Aestuariivirga sp.]
MPDPSNLDVEQALLGAVISDTAGHYLPQLVGLSPDHFSEGIHSRIFEAVIKLSAKGAFSGPLGLKAYFEQDATLAEIGGTGYIARLAALAAPGISLVSHAALLRDLAARRVAIDAAEALVERATNVNVDEPFRPVLAEHIANLQGLFDSSQARKTTYELAEANLAMLDRLERIMAGEADRNAIKTGIASLDAQTGGLHRGEYVILGGRPSMGKTALAVQIISNVAQNGGGAFYSSLEMPVALLTPRFASCRLWMPGETNIEYQSILRGQVSSQQAGWVVSAAKETESWPLIIDDAPGLTPSELEARAQVAKARLERAGRSLDLVVVDHLHKMRQPGCQSKVTEYTEISARLAQMAKRLDCPVLALAQLNRSVESRDDKRPQLSDLRESGSIEQDADVVLFVYRPEYYLERQRCAQAGAEADRLADLSQVRGKLEVIIEKQRSGPIGTVDLFVDVACNVVRDHSDLMPRRMAA